MLQKKVCMLGSYGVGKSSLVRQYVDSMFSEVYTTTIGVKIDKKIVTVGKQDVSLVLWDVYGEDNYQSVVPAYLRGMSGYLLILDPTRPNTFQGALSLHALVTDTLGPKPYVLVMNKSDLKDEWDTDASSIDELKKDAVSVVETSAKLDTGVTEVFDALTAALLSNA